MGLVGGYRQVLPGSSSYSMLGPNMNRGNPMQRTAMAPPKLISGMNVYMNQQQQQQQIHLQQQMPQQMQQMAQQQQQQESTSPLQAVLLPPQQQVGSPSMGGQQQASPQQDGKALPNGLVVISPDENAAAAMVNIYHGFPIPA